MVSDIFDTTLKDIRLTVPEHYRQIGNIKTVLEKLFYDANSYFLYGKFGSRLEVLKSITNILCELPNTTSIEDVIYKEKKNQILTSSMQTSSYYVDFIILLVYKYIKDLEYSDSYKIIQFANQFDIIQKLKDDDNFKNKLHSTSRKTELIKCLLYALLYRIYWYFMYENENDFERKFSDSFENNSGRVYGYIRTLHYFEKDQNILQTYLSEIREEIHVFKEEPEKFELASKILNLILDNESVELGLDECKHAKKINAIKTEIHSLIRGNRTPQM